MEKKQERQTSEVHCSPKKSYVSKNWRNINSSTEYIKNENQIDGGAISVPMDIPSSTTWGQSVNYNAKTNETYPMSTSTLSHSDDFGANEHILMNADWARSGLSPFNWSFPSDTQIESSASIGNILPPIASCLASSSFHHKSEPVVSYSQSPIRSFKRDQDGTDWLAPFTQHQEVPYISSPKIKPEAVGSSYSQSPLSSNNTVQSRSDWSIPRHHEGYRSSYKTEPVGSHSHLTSNNRVVSGSVWTESEPVGSHSHLTSNNTAVSGSVWTESEPVRLHSHSQLTSDNTAQSGSVWAEPRHQQVTMVTNSASDYVPDRSVLYDSNITVSAPLEIQQYKNQSPTISSVEVDKSTKDDRETEDDRQTTSPRMLKYSVFQRKYGLALPDEDVVNCRNESKPFQQSTGSSVEMEEYGLQAGDNHNVTSVGTGRGVENDNWQMEQFSYLSSTSENATKSDKSPTFKLDQEKDKIRSNKHDKSFNSKKTLHVPVNETVSHRSLNCDSGGVQDVTSTSLDVKISPIKSKKWLTNHKECQVCGDRSAGFYCNAFICEACKKFFMRACKQEKLKYVCLRDKNCPITKESRVQCQYCRYQKCLHLNMYCPASGSVKKEDKNVSNIPCRVCGAPSSGFHFGALTCEGCKGFFRRMAKERESNKYQCSKGGFCEINTLTRNMCKACRYKKCLEADMSIEASRIGRQPNAVKHAISLELQNRNVDNKADQFLKEPTDMEDDFPIQIKEEPFSYENSVDCFDYDNDFAMKEQLSFNSNTFGMPHEKSNGSEEMIILEDVTSKQEMQEVEKAEENFKMEETDEWKTELDESCLEIIEKLRIANEEVMKINKKDSENLSIFKDPKTCWTRMMEEFDCNAHNIIKFAKKVPGFKTLGMDDQVKLIQGSIYPIVVLNLTRCFDYETKSFNYFNYTKEQMESIFKLFPMLRILKSHFLHAGEMLHSIKLDELEYCFLSILLLFNGDVPDLAESDKVVDLQEELGYAIQMYEEKKYKGGITRYGLLLLRLAELQLFTVQHDLAIRSLLMANPLIEIPQLYQEIILKLNQ